ncbi:CIC11C00000005078 [Sungouiella intermedia]|uniref:CIC11C00000005078 n=1 Tax=Sungouiella intermedia TaxID=45354 RepID=A0A1L0C025_9ASCO|nr:CIC11C00000005078 [[Candida] intermedia]
MKLKLQVVLIPVSSADLPTADVGSYKKFLHLTDPQCSLQQVCDALVKRYYKLYPDAEPLQIEGVQDNDRCDLDPDFAAEDIFVSGDLLRVLVNNVLPSYSRETSTILPDTTMDHSLIRKRVGDGTLELEDSRFSKRSRTIWGAQRESSESPPNKSTVISKRSIAVEIPSSASNAAPNASNPAASSTIPTDHAAIATEVPNPTSPVSLPPPLEQTGYPVIPHKKLSPNVPNKGKRITSGMLQAPPVSYTNKKSLFSEDESDVSRMTTDFGERARHAQSSEPEEIENGTDSDDLVSNRLLKNIRKKNNTSNAAITMAPPPVNVGLTPSKTPAKPANSLSKTPSRPLPPSSPAKDPFVTLTPQFPHSSRNESLHAPAHPLTSLKPLHSSKVLPANAQPTNGDLQVYSQKATPIVTSGKIPLASLSANKTSHVTPNAVQSKTVTSSTTPAKVFPDVDPQISLAIPASVVAPALTQTRQNPPSVLISTLPVASASPKIAKGAVNASVSKVTGAPGKENDTANLSKEEILGMFKHGLRITNKINKKLAVGSPDPTPFLEVEAELKRNNHNLAQHALEIDNRRRAAAAASANSSNHERSLRSRVTIGGVPNSKQILKR